MVSMKNSLILLLIVVCNGISGITTQELYHSLINKYDGVKTFQADIEQASYFSELDLTNTSQGKLYHDPERLLIEYTSPKVEKVLLSDNIVRIYQAESDRLIMTYADSTIVSLKMGYLIKRIWDEDNLQLVEDIEHFVIKIKLTEENVLANIEDIELTISKDEMLVKSVKYHDDAENEVSVTFTNIIVNNPLAKEIWEIKTTNTTQIIDYRE